MARSKLHIICGNCGSNDMLSFHIDPEGHDVSSATEEYKPAVFITCGNCKTIHDLSNFVDEL